jgi:hypothetical protein
LVNEEAEDIEFANVIEDNPIDVLGEEFPNAPVSKLVTLAGISIEFKFHVSKNAINPIVVRVELFANVTDVIFVSVLNTLSSMLVTLFPISTLANLVV